MNCRPVGQDNDFRGLTEQNRNRIVVTSMTASRYRVKVGETERERERERRKEAGDVTADDAYRVETMAAVRLAFSFKYALHES